LAPSKATIATTRSRTSGREADDVSAPNHYGTGFITPYRQVDGTAGRGRLSGWAAAAAGYCHSPWMTATGRATNEISRPYMGRLRHPDPAPELDRVGLAVVLR
jgi:hypothetical protein